MIDSGIIRSYAVGIAKGYLRLAKSAGTILTALLVIAGISVAIENTGAGVAIGVALGVALGTFLNKQRKSTNHPKTS